MPSVVIAAHNEEDVIGQCLDALLSQNLPERLEIVVSANGFVDRIAEFPWKPDIGFPVPSFATCLTEALSPLAARFISHGIHPYCS